MGVFGLSPRAEVIVSVISYSMCSGSLVLVNKLILHYFPFPSIVVTMQLFASIFLIYGGNMVGIMEIDKLTMAAIKPYLIYTVAFSTGVYTNMMCLNTSNVETVIVARALSPLVVSLLDPIFLGRELPSKRSFAALGLIVLGAFGYASTDEQFKSQGMNAYIWPALYLAVITFEMVYGKKIVNGVEFTTLSGPVQYTNLLGWPPMIVFAQMGGEFDRLKDMVAEYGANSYTGLLLKLPNESLALMVMGCLVGTGIGYTGWWCRSKVSATSYTLIGVLNKCVTVLVNLMIWDNHAPPSGIMSLLLCLIGGSFYKQAPMRKEDGDEVMKAQAEKDKGPSKKEETDEESLTKPLLKTTS